MKKVYIAMFLCLVIAGTATADRWLTASIPQDGMEIMFVSTDTATVILFPTGQMSLVPHTLYLSHAMSVTLNGDPVPLYWMNYNELKLPATVIQEVAHDPYFEINLFDPIMNKDNVFRIPMNEFKNVYQYTNWINVPGLSR